MRYLLDKRAQKGYNESVMETIYLDNAATTPLDREVFEKIAPYYTELFGNADSPHAVGRRAMRAVDEARDTLASLMNAKNNEIYFTSGGTESDNWAILGGARAMREQGRTHIVISSIEHHACFHAVETLEREGFSVTYLPVNKSGRVESGALKEAITKNTGLVALMWANNETGVLQPIETACELAHEQGALFFTDAVQATPYLPIDVKGLGVDMLSFSGHKFHGVKGSGGLYIKNGVKIKKLVGGGEQERGLRGGTVNVPSVVALALAYEKTRAEQTQANEKIKGLSELFMKEIATLDGVVQNGDTQNALPSILNLRFNGVENTAFLYNMDLKGVCLAAGSACASASVKPSHVLTAMGLTEREAKESVRFSFGKTNTAEEIRQAASLTKETVNRLRG